MKTKYSAIQKKAKSVSRSQHNKDIKKLKSLRKMSVYYTHHGQISI